jgi:two-component system, NarL family, invasion response regulator UvrY
MKMERTTIKIAIVDDHNLFRKGLIKLIHLAENDVAYSIHFEAENGKDLKEKLVKDDLPEIILMDIDMPDMDGYQAVEWLGKTYPEISILVISMFESEESVLRMLRLGIKGYLSKDIEVEDIHKALEAITAKGYYYTDFVSETMANSFLIDTKKEASKNAIPLSDNELIFLKLACTELKYQEIAKKMILSPKTIDGYREALFSKFKVKNRIGLAMYAVKHGYVKFEDSLAP